MTLTSMPGALDDFSEKQDLVDDIMAADVNKLQDGVLALERGGHSAQSVTEGVLVSGVNAIAGEVIYVTLTANRSVGAPLNAAAGQRLHFVFTQNPTGGWALIFAPVFSIANWVLNTSPSARTELTLTYDGSAAKWVVALSVPPALVGPWQVNLQGRGADMSGQIACDAIWDAALAEMPGGPVNAKGRLVIPAGTVKVASRRVIPTGLEIAGLGSRATTLDARMVTGDWVIVGYGNGNTRLIGFRLQLRSPDQCRAAPLNIASYAAYWNFPPGTLGFVGGVCPGQYGVGYLEDINVDGGSVGIALANDPGSTLFGCRAGNARSHNLSISGNMGAVNSAGHIRVIGGTYQVANAGANAAVGEFPANVRLTTDGAGRPRRVSFYSVLFDEIGINTAAGGSCAHVDSADDVTFDHCQFYAGGRRQVGGGYYFGVRIGPTCSRVSLNNSRIEPYVADSVHVPNQTLLIEAGATDTQLVNLTTDPNAANGGGDISDLGTGSTWVNVNGLTKLPGLLATKASAAAVAGLNIPHGAAPTSPLDGDMWTTNAGLFVRIKGVTKQVTLTDASSHS